MNTLLQVHASLNSDHGESSQLSDRFAERWAALNPGGKVIRRDLASAPLPHLTAERFTAWRTPVAERSLDQQRHVAESDALIAELRAADTLVLAVPMYNFGIPSTLKAWIDHVARAGETFRYGANGPEGLLAGKRAVIFTTRGGQYAGTPGDTEAPYLQQILGFLGIVDVEIVYAEGLGMGQRAESLADAHARIDQWTAERKAA
jgi:FMN-dependent NADH-azoreductase